MGAISLRYSSWLLPCCRHSLLQSIRSCPFLGKVNFCDNRHVQLQQLCHDIQNILNVYHSHDDSIFFSPILSRSASYLMVASVATESISLQFPLPDCGYHYGCYTQSHSMCKVQIVLQELQTVTFMLCIIAFHLFRKCYTLHLNNSKAKVYLCNHCGRVSIFLSRLIYCIINLANTLVLLLIPVYIPISTGKQIICPEWDCLWNGIFSIV